MNLRDPQEIPEEEYFGDFKDLNQDQNTPGFGQFKNSKFLIISTRRLKQSQNKLLIQEFPFIKKQEDLKNSI